jgi:hypothetical protein
MLLCTHLGVGQEGLTAPAWLQPLNSGCERTVTLCCLACEAGAMNAP